MDELLELVTKTLDDKQAEDIVVIDLRGHNPYVDYFVVAEASNARKANMLVDEVIDVAAKNGFDYRNNTNSKEAKWLLADLGSVVVHVFYDGERARYNLEGLWKDLPMRSI